MEVENPPLEGVRKLIVENLKMSRIAMQSYINFLETMMRSCPGASEEQVGAFKAHLEKQVETNHAFVEQLLHAKDFPDALRIESEYFQSQLAEVLDRLNERKSAVDDIKPNQIWTEGSTRVRVTNAFGVRILIRRENADADEEITEEEFRKRFTYVSG